MELALLSGTLQIVRLVCIDSFLNLMAQDIVVILRQDKHLLSSYCMLDNLLIL